jgi:hypothetical protein
VRLVHQAFLTQKIAHTEDGNNPFLASHREHRELGLSLLDVKDGVGGVALTEHRLFGPIPANGLTTNYFG